MRAFGEDIGIQKERENPYKEGNIIKSYTQICNPIKLDSGRLGVYAFKSSSIGAKVGLHTELKSILKDSSDLSVLLAVFYQEGLEEFRLSLVTQGYDYEKEKPTFSNLSRQSFLLGKNTKTKTAETQLGGFLHSQKSLNDLKEAFSVEPLNKEFYNAYNGLFEKLTKKLNKPALYQALEGYEGLSGERAIKAFVKKLLGRIVFLYFLQKKGWLGVPKGEKYGQGDKKFLASLFQKSEQSKQSFYEKYLCPLFFETLNQKREEDYSTLFESKMPFLNGGLFEEGKNHLGEGVERNFILSKSLENKDFEQIFEVFESYNFTIEESTPDNVEIGIDPEMLGRVFENLIDYNKQNGAFYTPKSIVHFMCKNILARILQEHCIKESLCKNDADKEAIRDFILYHKRSDFINNNTKKLEKIIKSLKILDPCIGSGAFPMGLLNEILHCLRELKPELKDKQIAHLKREIIQNQIYGIDIDADAIEIAKLRFWLSIAVDESEPSPLPNLDFKFMQGNALLEKIKQIEIVKEARESSLFDEANIGDSLFSQKDVNTLQKLFVEYYQAQEYKSKQSTKAKILKLMQKGFEERIGLIESFIQTEKKNPKIKPKEISKQQEYILQLLDFKDELKKICESYRENNFHSDKLFLWDFFFAPVLEQGGFDVVIGNPPYIRQESIKNKVQILQEFQSQEEAKNMANSTADIYTYFYAKGLEKLREGGILSFITSNKWCRAGYGKNLRKYLLQYCLDSHYDLNGIKAFENATVDTAITTILKSPPSQSHALCFANPKDYNPKDNEPLQDSITPHSIPQSSLNSEGFIFNSPEVAALKAKIESIGTPLKDWDISIYRGILTGYNEAFIIDTTKREEILNSCDDSKESLLPYPLSEYDERLCQTDSLYCQTEISSCHSEVFYCHSERSEESQQPQFISPSLAEGARGWGKSQSKRDVSASPQHDKQDSNCHSEPALAGEESHLIQRKINLENNTILLTERERTAQLLKPILRGRDIKRYSYEWAGLWIIFISWHFPNTDNPKSMQENEQDLAEQYPSLYSHLLQHKDRLSKRNKDETGIRYEWYCLQRWGANYYQEFAKPKIVYSEIVREPQFYLDNGEFKFGHFYAEATSFILSANCQTEALESHNPPPSPLRTGRGNNPCQAEVSLCQTNSPYCHSEPLAEESQHSKRDISLSMKAQYDKGEAQHHKMQVSLEYLLGILHSKLATFAFKEFYAGGGLGESGYRYKKAFLEKLPIPRLDKTQEAEFVRLVNEILETKAQNKDTSKLEQTLDSMVFALYGLDDKQRAMITAAGGGQI
ncbi:Eco57I restriction-modification methylase domain-containing protein [Helicobacter mesocricetorum]|uniref:Eco57I restriction-modification methylase domain-containing protein n=1 Tax=Helicobacter mesocricetorum TaxID=87012 RepID=UPI000CF080EF|nr:Eco57I restriction-modification methylase domain-containing protein [Helicobacter mesocricetorum]